MTEINTTPIILRMIPTPAIWRIVTKPEENTIALGGVPMGSIKAQLDAKVKGTHNCSISNPADLAKAATMGTNITTSARLDKNSVAKMAIVTVSVIITKIET